MNKKIIWTEQAKAHLRAINQTSALRILHAIALYKTTGQGDLKRIQGSNPPEFRLRMSDYRIRFYDRAEVITILAIGHRRVVYR